MGALRFSMADTGADPTRAEEEPAQSDIQADAARSGIDVTVEVTDEAGNTATMALGDVMPLARSARPDLFKSRWVRSPVGAEPVFQTYVFDFDGFRASNAAFDPAGIREVAFVFDRTREGVILLQGVGLEPGSDTPWACRDEAPPAGAPRCHEI